jgi:hypothetical protein
MSKDEGGSAFPQVESQQVGSQGEYHTEVYSVGGMSLRDYFAAKAMQSIVAGAIAQGGATEADDAPELARVAWLMADAMLATRKPPNAMVNCRR